MILTNLGSASVTNNTLGAFTAESEMEYLITSSDGAETKGVLAASGYSEVTAKGSGPWTVKMGKGAFSVHVSVSGVDSQEAMLSCLIVWPGPANSPHIFINN